MTDDFVPSETMKLRVAGISHYQEAASHCKIGDSLELVPEPSNPYDSNAIRVDCHGRKIGYIARDTAPQVKRLMNTNSVTAVVFDVLGERRLDFSLGIELQLTIGPV